MHTYSTDNDARPKVLALLGGISLGTVLALKQFLPWFSTHFLLGITLSAPSFALIFGLVYGGFNRYLWNHPVLHILGLVQVPDLSGHWEGFIETSYDGDISGDMISPEDDSDSTYTRIDASLDIKQHWRKISIRFKTATSSSHSQGATLLVNENVWPSLNYQYENQPPPDTPETMQMHHGTADLELRNDGTVLEGVYYTGPGRQNHGKIYFEHQTD